MHTIASLDTHVRHKIPTGHLWTTPWVSGDVMVDELAFLTASLDTHVRRLRVAGMAVTRYPRDLKSTRHKIHTMLRRPFLRREGLIRSQIYLIGHWMASLDTHDVAPGLEPVRAPRETDTRH